MGDESRRGTPVPRRAGTQDERRAGADARDLHGDGTRAGCAPRGTPLPTKARSGPRASARMAARWWPHRRQPGQLRCALPSHRGRGGVRGRRGGLPARAGAPVPRRGRGHPGRPRGPPRARRRSGSGSATGGGGR